MRKAGLALLFVLGLLAAGGLSAGVVAATTTTGTTGTTTTEPEVIAPGVTISGVDVGNLTQADAFRIVTDSFASARWPPSAPPSSVRWRRPPERR